MKSYIHYVCLLFSIGCGVNNTTDITVPEFNSDIYTEALVSIDDLIHKNPDNLRLNSQKLNYCIQANWPSTCKQALDVYQDHNGMSDELFEKYLQFYESNDLKDELILFINKWADQYQVPGAYLQLLISDLLLKGDTTLARHELNDLLLLLPELSSYAYAASFYLQTEDTLKSVYYHAKVRKLDSTNHLIPTYAKLLYDLRYHTESSKMIQEFYKSMGANTANVQSAFDMASFYSGNREYSLARQLIRGYTSDSAYWYISDLYIKDQLYDSALLYLDSILLKNPSNKKVIIAKAELYEQKGWLNTSLIQYEKVLELDTGDSSILSKVELIKGKIAYLQRRKLEESKKPLLQLESIKLNNE